MKLMELLSKKYEGEHHLERTTNEIETKLKQLWQRKGETARLRSALRNGFIPEEKIEIHEYLLEEQEYIIKALSEELSTLIRACANGEYDVLFVNAIEKAEPNSVEEALGHE